LKFARRQFLHLAVSMAALPVGVRGARAQSYPARPVRWMVPFAAGGPNDILARLLGQELSERLRQPFIIENRPGAGGNIGTEAVVRAAPDGYTLLMIATPQTINPALYDNLSFNFSRDIAPIATIIQGPLVLVVNPSVPAKTIPEFIAYAKANPRKINMAYVGNGSVSHVAGELFKTMTGIDLTYVPYRGGAPALTDVIGGQAQLYFVPTVASLEHIRSGRLRALAVTTAKRSEFLPDIPALAEFLPGYEATIWFAVGAPKDTPAEIIDRLNKEINAALTNPKLKVQLAELGGTVMVGSPDDFRKLIASETEKWGKIVRDGNIKPE